MKKNIFSISIMILMSANLASAFTIVRPDGTVVRGGSSGSSREALSLSVTSCSDEINPYLNAKPSTTDEACKLRVDWAYKRCVIDGANILKPANPNARTIEEVAQDKVIKSMSEACVNIPQTISVDDVDIFVGCSMVLRKSFGPENMKTVGEYCARANNSEFGSCVDALSSKGVRSGQALEEVCNSRQNVQITSCTIDEVRRNRTAITVALQSCREQFDPELRRQAEERRRIEQERIRKEAAAKEAARQAAQKAADEAKRKADAEAQRKADEAKKNNGGVGTTPTPANPAPQPGGVGTTPVPQPAPQPSNPTPAPAPPKSTTPPPAPQPLPQDPAGSGGGVIVDLPNF